MANKINKNKVIAVAQKFVQKGQYDKAIKEYGKIVEEDPRDVRIWLKIGDLYAKKNASKEAVETYLKVAEFYSEQGFYLKAVAVYKQILKIDSTLVEINLKLAELYKQLGLLSDAMQQYEQVSNSYNQGGRTKDALAAVRQIVELDPQNVASRIKLAELYSKEDMRDEAVREFAKAADFLRAESRIEDFIKVAERLIFHQQNNLGVTKELAQIYLQKRDPRRALQKLQLAFKVDPRDAETLDMLANAFEDLGQLPKTVSVLKELAHIHAENGDEAQRRVIYQRVLTLAPQDEEASQALGLVGLAGMTAPAASPEAMYNAQQSRHSGFLSTNTEIPQPQPSYEPIASGHPYYEEIPTPYHLPAAKEDYEPAANPDPYDYSLDNEQGEYEAEPEVIEEAEEESPGFSPYDDFAAPEPEQASVPFAGSQEAPDDVAKILTEADVYIKYGLQEKAIEHLRRLFHRDPENIEVHLKLKELYLKMGRFYEAAREFLFLGRQYMHTDQQRATAFVNEALNLDPENREARALLSALERAQDDGGGGPNQMMVLPDQVMASRDEDIIVDYDAIDLEVEDIVEEIPIDAEQGFSSEWSSVPDAEGSLVESESTQPPWSSTEEQRFDEPSIPDASASRLESEPNYNQVNSTPGILELHDEIADTLGGGRRSSSEVIQLGDEPMLYQGHIKSHPEEERSSIEDDLEEAEFFIQQNLFSEASAILDELSHQYPNHPLIEAKFADLQLRESKIHSTDEEPQEQFRESFSDLAAELSDINQAELAQEFVANFSVEDVFEEFKKGTRSPGGDEDSDTHYDLGLAYREMGLLDDAIAEFNIAMHSPEKEVLCHMMIGLCYVEKDLLPDAIGEFKTGLYVESITDRETIALYFELGQSYERLDDLQEALYYYEKVVKKDSNFRDVTGRIQEIYRRAAETNAPLQSDMSDSNHPKSP